MPCLGEGDPTWVQIGPGGGGELAFLFYLLSSYYLINVCDKFDSINIAITPVSQTQTSDHIENSLGTVPVLGVASLATVFDKVEGQITRSRWLKLIITGKFFIKKTKLV